MTFADSNQEDMLQSLVHSESPAREEQGGRLSRSTELGLRCINQCFFTGLLIYMTIEDVENIYQNSIFKGV